MNEIRLIQWNNQFLFNHRVILVGNGSPLHSPLQGEAYQDYLYRAFAQGDFIIVNEMDRLARLVQDDSGEPVSLLYVEPIGKDHAEIIKGILHTVLEIPDEMQNL